MNKLPVELLFCQSCTQDILIIALRIDELLQQPNIFPPQCCQSSAKLFALALLTLELDVQFYWSVETGCQRCSRRSFPVPLHKESYKRIKQMEINGSW